MMDRACAFIVCPHCGYKILMPRRSALVELFKRIAKWSRSHLRWRDTS